MTTKLSSMAQIDPAAQLGTGVEIGPFCVVGPHVQIGDGTRLDSHVVIDGHTVIGSENRFFPGAVIGTEPQDVGYAGAPTRLVIGDGNIFREGVTVHRGAEKDDQVTRIGNDNMLMANCHVAHNSHVFDKVILVNGVLLGGHVQVHDGAIVSGNSVVHHFSTLGTLCFVSGGSRVPRDVPPYMVWAGSDTPRVRAVNVIGMQRNEIPFSSIQLIKRAHKLLFRQNKRAEHVRALLQDERNGEIPAELRNLLDFLSTNTQGRLGRSREGRKAA